MDAGSLRGKREGRGRRPLWIGEGSRNHWAALCRGGASRSQLLCALQDSSQIELLKELLDLQKDMVVMLLSLLEGEHRSWGGEPYGGSSNGA